MIAELRRPEIPAPLRGVFEEERRRHTIAAAWAINVVALFMYPPSTLLDWVTAREHYAPLSIIRFATVGGLLVYLLFLHWMRRTGRAERHAYGLTWGLAFTIIPSLSLFTTTTGGPGSHYFGGLTMLITAIVVALPWGVLRMGTLLLALIVQFNVVLLLVGDWPWNEYFIVNYFYVGNSFIGLWWRYANEHTLRSEFLERSGAKTDRAVLATTLDSIGDAVITTDERGRVTLMNPVAGDLTGWPPEQAEGLPLPEVFHLLDLKTRAPLTDTILPPDGEARWGAGTLAAAAVLVSRDGIERVVDRGVAPLCQPHGDISGYVLAFRDITVRHQMAGELEMVQKLESVGVLAGGIAHDFNNLLTSIWGSVALAKSDTLPDHPATRWLVEAERGVMRARDLTQQLLTFSKGGAPVRKPTRIGSIILEAAGFSLRGSNVRCEFSVPDDLWMADVDAGQLNQVLSNLVINADEAMPDGGRIHIHAQNLETGAPLPKMLPPGRYIQITVKDQGVGIPPELQTRVFEPYFSTKKKGSGLGLSICLSIMLKHGGTLTLESARGKGTSFHAFLPACDKQEEEAETAKARPLEKGQGRVLVMDDDEMIREIASHVLKRLGYECVTEPDGAAAVQSYSRAWADGHPFDIVILDLTVPGGMGGKEAARQILALDANAKLIVSSGYSADPVMAEYEKHGFKGVLRKPYEPAALSRLLQELLA